jgi:arylformamidase
VEVYRNFDQAALDRQYDVRQRFPYFPAVCDRWDADSELAVAELTNELDLAYGPSDRQKLDLFRAKTPGRPTLVYFHGGNWQAMDKHTFRYLARDFVQLDVNFVLVNTDLCPAITLEDQVVQAERAVAWLHDNAARLGIAPDRIFACGHSSGAHIAARLLATDWAVHGASGFEVSGAVLLAGLFDLEPIRHSFMNKGLGLDDARAARLSPVLNVPDSERPVIIAVGGEDTFERQRQSSDYAAVLRSRGWPVQYLVVKDHESFALLLPFSDPAMPLFQAVRKMVEA